MVPMISAKVRTTSRGTSDADYLFKSPLGTHLFQIRRLVLVIPWNNMDSIATSLPGYHGAVHARCHPAQWPTGAVRALLAAQAKQAAKRSESFYIYLYTRPVYRQLTSHADMHHGLLQSSYYKWQAVATCT